MEDARAAYFHPSGISGVDVQARDGSEALSIDPDRFWELAAPQKHTLVHIKPEQLLQATRIFFEDASFSENMVTVKIWNNQIPKFEEMLRKLDVEKKTIQFQAFAVLASRDPASEVKNTVENKDLKRVLDELRGLWNFKSYEVDGPSYLTIREGSGPNAFKLVTNRALNLLISNVKVTGEEVGKRTVSVGQLKLTGMANFVDYVFIDTADVTLKENGYLVAGVSGFGSTSKAAMILVINAEIK